MLSDLVCVCATCSSVFFFGNSNQQNGTKRGETREKESISFNNFIFCLKSFSWLLFLLVKTTTTKKQTTATIKQSIKRFSTFRARHNPSTLGERE